MPQSVAINNTKTRKPCLQKYWGTELTGFRYDQLNLVQNLLVLPKSVSSREFFLRGSKTNEIWRLNFAVGKKYVYLFFSLTGGDKISCKAATDLAAKIQPWVARAVFCITMVVCSFLFLLSHLWTWALSLPQFPFFRTITCDLQISVFGEPVWKGDE
jgi:hypothetical protein